MRMRRTLLLLGLLLTQSQGFTPFPFLTSRTYNSREGVRTAARRESSDDNETTAQIPGGVTKNTNIKNNEKNNPAAAQAGDKFMSASAHLSSIMERIEKGTDYSASNGNSNSNSNNGRLTSLSPSAYSSTTTTAPSSPKAPSVPKPEPESTIAKEDDTWRDDSDSTTTEEVDVAGAVDDNDDVALLDDDEEELVSTVASDDDEEYADDEKMELDQGESLDIASSSDVEEDTFVLDDGEEDNFDPELLETDSSILDVDSETDDESDEDEEEESFDFIADAESDDDEDFDESEEDDDDEEEELVSAYSDDDEEEEDIVASDDEDEEEEEEIVSVPLEPEYVPPRDEWEDCQHWLEDVGVPINTVTPDEPVTASVLDRYSLIDENEPGDIQHVVLQIPENFRFVEGQCISVIPPGTQRGGRPHKPRLFHIASTRYGDDLEGDSVSLCVRRSVYFDPVAMQIDDSKAGVCSNFLCDVLEGDKVEVSGPVGEVMLLPEDPSTDIIMIATGTGIAPFRGFLRRLFAENTVAAHLYTGTAWLITSMPTSGSLLYSEEMEAMKRLSEGRLEVDHAISFEMTNPDGSKMHVQDILLQQAAKLWDRLDQGAVVYICGLQGMLRGIVLAMEEMADERGIDWDDYFAELKEQGRWRVELY